MSKDFTLEKYSELIECLKKQGYAFQSYSDFIQNPKEKTIILRHDVDLKPGNALKIAEIEKKNNVTGSYYFRMVPESYNREIIIHIAKSGHEIGYHYETVDKVSSCTTKENIIDKAYELFCEELEKLRKISEVKTICMHGSPRGKYDNKIIWKKYDYRQLGVIGEPYLDIDWDSIGYLTDTGRRWNGDKFIIRDKVNSKYKLDFKTTDDIINNINLLPNKLMITVHPQRWCNSYKHWAKELMWQNIKNAVKWFKIKSNI